MILQIHLEKKIIETDMPLMTSQGSLLSCVSGMWLIGFTSLLKVPASVRFEACSSSCTWNDSTFQFSNRNVSKYGKEWEWRGLAFSLRRIFFSSNCIGLRQRELVIQSQIQGLTKAWHVTNLTAQGWSWAVIDVCCCAFFVWWNNK